MGDLTVARYTFWQLAIALALVISERTVENHMTSIFKKMGVGSRAELIARASAAERT